ncbi:hypothetical protein [Roseibium sp.]|uniref:hypothetical protein n=1 Tax=Roseibium sp. TaxID=1936156 RepID=UPI003BACC58B
MDRFDQLRGAKAQEMWCIFKPFATMQMAKTAKSEGRQNGLSSQRHCTSPGIKPALPAHPREIRDFCRQSASFMSPTPDFTSAPHPDVSERFDISPLRQTFKRGVDDITGWKCLAAECHRQKHGNFHLVSSGLKSFIQHCLKPYDLVTNGHSS